MNLLGKAATSPFTLLSKLVGGGAEDLGYIDFAPGAAHLDAAGLDKIQKLAKALYERPALAVEISPAVDPVADRDAIAKAKLAEALKMHRLKELNVTNHSAVALAAVTLTDADRQRLLTAFYVELIGPLTNTVGSVTNQTGAAAPALAKTSPKTSNFTWGTLTNGLAGSTTKIVAISGTSRTIAVPQNPAEMEVALLAQIPVTDNDLRQLLKDRAQQVQTALLQEKDPPETDRLFVTNPEIPKPDPANPVKPRVNLSLQ